MAPDAPDPQPVGYGAAVDELETILVAIERDDIDIDQLGPQVERAAALIALCRERISSARLDVERIVTDLDALD